MEHDAFDNVVGCMAERDDRCRGLDARTLEKVVPKLSGGSLDRASRERIAPALHHHFDAEPVAQVRDVRGRSLRSRLEGMVVVRGDHVVAQLESCDQEGG